MRGGGCIASVDSTDVALGLQEVKVHEVKHMKTVMRGLAILQTQQKRSTIYVEDCPEATASTLILQLTL